MALIWSGPWMCHLQAYTSRMQMLFSWRKDNVPKRCLPDNNIGQEGGIALPSALYWETRPTVLNRSFSRFKWEKSYLHILALVFKPTQGCHKTVIAWRTLGTPWSVSTAPKGTMVLVVWYSYLYKLVHYPDACSSKETVENWSLIA